jgi:hypothetical protein
VLQLDALEVIQRFRKPGGNEFVSFCNRIIYASCWASGVAQSEIWTTSRTDAKDKGVDTRVCKPIGNDRSGYFGSPTIWQFKAADEAGITAKDVRKEANKPRAKQWIAEGSAYRMCICDHLTPDKKQTLLDALCAATTEINPQAPSPKILSVDDLVEVANSFPALVLDYVPKLDAMVLLFEAWSQLATGITKIFVPPPDFLALKDSVLAHVELANDVRSPVITLYGSAGAGKTRVVLECLKAVPAASSLCLYLTSEQDARDIANMLINNQRAHAIIVADECSIEVREELSRTLMNFRNRIRCVCIDNSLQRLVTQQPELVVRKLSVAELEKVLEANFETIPQDRIRAYAQFCDGSVRLAADMCANFDAEIAQAGTMSAALGKTNEYYRVRLSDDRHRRAVEAIALLKRVRHKGEAPTDLDLICELTGATKKEIEQGLAEIKDSPGWVEKGALYYRVTPDLIAMTAFMSAWNRWAQDDEQEFLQKIPAAIQESFLQRVSESAKPEVRETVQRFFRKFADGFSVDDLGEIKLVNRFVSLIDTDSSLYLPALRRVIEGASPAQLVAGPEWTGQSWGPRRQLVWTAERFALFPEHFEDCEAILFMLARHESEPRIGNNATKTWQRLFRLQLSGTSLPLLVRLNVLRRRLDRATANEAELFVGVFGDLLDFMSSRFLGPPVVGGRVPPTEWHPASWTEMRESVAAALVLLDSATQHPVTNIAAGARSTLIGDVEHLTRNGWIDELRPFVARSQLSESEKALIVNYLKRFLGWGKHPNDSPVKPEYAAKVREWIEEIAPRSFHARLVESVGSAAMDHFQREREWQKDLSELATELLSTFELLQEEIEWLTSSEAQSAFEFGYQFGLADVSAEFIDKLLEQSRGRGIGFLRGYVAGLLSAAKVSPEVVSLRLDNLEKDDPLLSFQVALAGGSQVAVFDRACRLIKSGKIPAYHLRSFTYWVGNVRVTNKQVLEAIRLLLPFATEDSFASDVMVDFLGARAYSKELDVLLRMDNDLVWSAIVAAAKNPGQESYWLTHVLLAAAPTNWPLAIQLACDALIGGNYEFEHQAENLLANWAREYPEEVMTRIGILMLDEKVGWKFFTSKLGIFHALPENVVIHWLKGVGVKGAQKVARHLPKPFIDASGRPIVPPLTEFVLSHFEADEPTFREFCAGTHSFQMYVGDIASQRESEAAAVRPFFNHPLKRIQQWARQECDSGFREATWHRERDDEMGI